MVWRAVCLFVCALAATAAFAHRPGESYVYIDVTDTEMSGEFHIRLADMAKALELDADGDGSITDAEVEAQRAEIFDDLEGRLFFYAGGARHRIEPQHLRFFGNPKVRQMVVEFDLPSLTPVPDTVDVAYRFLYDGPDPAHRPMLLQNSNTRLRLAENEWYVSLVFEPGAERHTLSLVPPPAAPLFVQFMLHGAYMMLSQLDRLLLIGVLLLPVVVRRQSGSWQSQVDGAAAARSVAATGLALALGMAAALYIRTTYDLRLAPPYDSGLLVLSLALVAADNFRPIPKVRRWQVALAAGLLQGAGRNDYVGLSGLTKGMPEIVLSGFALGVMLAFAVVAAVLVPILVLVQDTRLYRVAALRLGSVLLVGVGAAWFATRMLV